MPVTLRRLIALLLLAAAAALLAWAVLGPRGAALQVEAQTWRLVIEIEKRVTETDSGWCAQLPPGAQVLARSVRSDPSRPEAEPAAHCRYSVSSWRALRSVQTEGGIDMPPRWPLPDLNGLPDEQLGAERAGKRHEFYELGLRADDGRRWTCRLLQPQWAAFRRGERLRLPVDRWGTADCGALPQR